MNTAGSLLKGSFFRTLDLLVLLVATFVVTPVLVHALGGRLYGFWSLVGAIVGYYGFLDLGLTAAAARYMSQSMGKDDLSGVKRVANTAYFLFSAAALVVVAAAALTALSCPRLISDPVEAALFQKLIMIMGVGAAIAFPSKVYSGMLTAGIGYDAIASISIGRTLLSSAAIYLCLRRGYGIILVALITVGVNLLQYAALRAACRARFPLVRIAVRRFDAAQVRAMFGYGSKMLVCQLGDILRSRVGSLVIAGALNASLVTPYVIGARLAECFSQLVSSSMGMLLPVFSRYEGRGDYDAIRSALLKVTKLGTILSAFLGLSVMFYARAFIERWMGPGFESSTAVALILSVAFMIGLPQSPGIQLLYGLSRHKSYAVLNVCEGLVNLALSLMLVRRFGVYGVALATLLEMAVFKLLIQPALICRAISLPVRTYLLETILLTALKTAAPLAAYFYLIERFIAPDYAVLAAAAAVQTALFAPAAYYFILGDAERQAVAGGLRALARRRSPAWAPTAREG